eukprot:TRINITY_DN10494_c0_g1_i1.p1 TRINITY_DN10494_c0_g1~~TRINITY_DN10494_c0_g1_i1.p1  ORF type:complete len:190 (-),score=30.62 TRINITY_DN10494_c0_g1_i1:22-591(-)
MDKERERIYSKNHIRCEEHVIHNLEHDNIFLHILKSMQQLGAEITNDFINCMPCPVPAAGFYDPRLGIVLCEDTSEVNGNATRNSHILRHEAIHAYDTLRARMDERSCMDIACSEIRAANLSGQCKYSREILRGNFSITKHQQDCVSRIAKAAVAMQPQCKDFVEEIFDEVWLPCFNDTAPFPSFPDEY